MPEIYIDSEIDPRAYQQQEEGAQEEGSQSPPRSNFVTPGGAAETQRPDVVIVYSTPPSPSPYESYDTLSTLEREDTLTPVKRGDSLRELKRPRVSNFTTTGGRLGLGLNEVPKISVVEARENVLANIMRGDPVTTFVTAALNYSPWGLLIDDYKYLDSKFARNKAAYWAGAGFGAASSVAASYLLGAGAAGALASSSRGLAFTSKLVRLATEHPHAAAALKGTTKGLLLGTETAKGIIMKMEGKSWGDVGLTLARDFGAFYAFEKGATRAFNSIRRSAVRKNFADKKSRIFIGEAEQEFIWQDKKGTHVIRAKKPTIVENWPGSLNTKAKPRTVGFRLSKSMERMIHAPGSSKPGPDLPDELRFLQNEPKLPEPLFSEKSIVVKDFTTPARGGKAAGTLMLEEPITLERLSTSSARASEAARVGNLKREFAGMMKSIENAAKATASALGGAAKVAGTSSLRGSGSPRAAKGSKSITKPRVLFETGVGNIAGEFRMGPPKLLPEPPKVIKAPKGSHGSVTSTASGTETLFKHWTGVGDVYAEFEIFAQKQPPKQTPEPRPRHKYDELNMKGIVPLDFPRLDEPEKQVEKSLKRMNFVLTPPELPKKPPKKPPKFPSGRGGLAWFLRGKGARGSRETWGHSAWQKRYGNDLFKFNMKGIEGSLKAMERSLKKLEKSLAF